MAKGVLDDLSGIFPLEKLRDIEKKNPLSEVTSEYA